MLDNIIEEFKEYFRESTVYLDMTGTDEKRIRLGCSKTKVYLNIYWDDIFCLLDIEEDFEAINTFIYSQGPLNKKAFIGNIFEIISQERLYSNRKNKVKIWSNKLHSFNNRYAQGFYKDNYAEFGIELNVDVVNKERIFNFKIGNVDVNISDPSDIYRMIFQSTKLPGAFLRGVEDDITISLKKNDKSKLKLEEVESYLQQALFALNLYYSNVFVFGISDNRNKYYDTKYQNKYLDEFLESKHIEPIIYYNEGVNSAKESKFYCFYKVLEYYFDVNIRDSIKEIITCEGKSKDEKNINKKNLDELVDRILGLATNNKEMKLVYLLENKNIIDDINEIKDSYFYRADVNNIKAFARKIYKYRNNLIHSEEKTRRLPLLLTTFYDDLSIEDWNELIRRVAIICINGFSYDNKLKQGSLG